jgi:hypothetical protein
MNIDHIEKSPNKHFTYQLRNIFYVSTLANMETMRNFKRMSNVTYVESASNKFRPEKITSK